MSANERTFYVGAPAPAWLARTTAPLFVSHVRLRGRRTLPRAVGRWALDSGGFSEIAQHGRWTIDAGEYVDAVRRYRDEVGGLDWAAPQDWMCEPDMLAKTGLTLDEHLRRTVANFVELRERAPDLPIAPVVQGWTVGSYVRCAEMYRDAGVDLAAERRVGVGSVCRRSTVVAASLVFARLHDEVGLRNLHGFGVKTSGLAVFAEYLASADSMGWSFAARSRGERCEQGRRDCRNCMHYAVEWADEVRIAASWHREPEQLNVPAPRPAFDGRLFDLAPAGALF
jgi:hypothetical protein